MPAESKKQQRFFGMVHAVQKGELSPGEVGPAVRKAARNTEYSDAKDIASTKHKNLPEKVAGILDAIADNKKAILWEAGTTGAIVGGTYAFYKPKKKKKKKIEKVGAVKNISNLASKWKGTVKIKLKNDADWRTIKVDSGMSADDITKLMKSTKPGRTKKGSLQMKYFEKVAKEEAGYWGKNMAQARAARSSDTGVGTAFADPKLIKQRFKKSLSYGIPAAVGGATVGGLIGKAKGYPVLGAAIGGVIAGEVASGVGMQKATQQYLAKKGIGVSMWGNVKTMTPASKKKYLHEKYRGGGFKPTKA